MKQLLNTLFVTSADTYLALENGNVVIMQEGEVLRRFPLHLFEQIVYFGYKGASPALMGECAKQGIGLSFFNQYGKFLARVTGNNYGNVLLRKRQYRVSDDINASCFLARNFIVGKIYNSRGILERFYRDHGLSLNADKLKADSKQMLTLARRARVCTDLDKLRGLEGEAASIYFSNFNDLILQNKKYFIFGGRIKDLPTDAVNAMLSFAYTMLANDCASALESIGLDPYIGFLHRDRPGRISLALDLMEELRSVFADRFILKLINNRIVNKNDFEIQENGSILLNENARKKFLSNWQDRKREIITHPFLEDKISWGLVPFIQAQLLARFLRGDLEEYPSFMWK